MCMGAVRKQVGELQVSNQKRRQAAAQAKDNVSMLARKCMRFQQGCGMPSCTSTGAVSTKVIIAMSRATLVLADSRWNTLAPLSDPQMLALFAYLELWGLFIYICRVFGGAGISVSVLCFRLPEMWLVGVSWQRQLRS